MVSCAIPNCKSRYTKGTASCRFHSLPRDEKRRNEWIKFSKRSNFDPSGRYYFCELHFDESQYELNRKDKWRKLKPNGIPTIFLPPSTDPKRCCDIEVQDSSDLSINKNEKIAELKKGNTCKFTTTSNVLDDSLNETASNTSIVEIEIDDFQNENEKLRSENEQLRNMIVKMQLVLQRRKANEINYLCDNERLRKENLQLRNENANLKKELANCASIRNDVNITFSRSNEEQLYHLEQVK